MQHDVKIGKGFLGRNASPQALAQFLDNTSLGDYAARILICPSISGPCAHGVCPADASLYLEPAKRLAWSPEDMHRLARESACNVG